MILCAALLAGTVTTAADADMPQPIDTPYFKDRVAQGKLPPVAARIPAAPFVVDMKALGKTPGRHGGELRTIMGRTKDVRMMVVYGYARLVAYDKDLNLYPDILERFEAREQREFTFYLRKGHRWSDGHPFTAADFAYYWDDVANNDDLSPFGFTKALLVDGKPPRFEVLNDTTVRYTWDKPNPYFLPALAAPSPMFIYRPAHYLKKYHARYADPAKLAKLVKKKHKRNWAGLHVRMDRQYRNDNPKLPILQPWRNTTKPPAELFIFERNPYYHRIDTAGRQLPYIDRVLMRMSSKDTIPTSTGTGGSDLQARYIRFDNYTFLKKAEKNHEFTVHLWRTVKGAQIALFPNLNAADDEWRKVLRDVRFRRALSLAINRHEINQVVYFGLAKESNNTVLEASPLFKPEYRTAWTDFDLKRASALLDEMGLTERDEDGFRLLPDKRVMTIIVETAGESTEETDVLEMIRFNWRKIGVELFAKPSQREIFRRRIFAGSALMSIWSGITNGIAKADMSPQELAPTTQQQYQWPKWGQYVETNGSAGEPPDMPLVQELSQLNAAWQRTSDPTELDRIWHRMLQINSDQVYTIGVVNGTLQPVVVNNRLRNVLKDGFYNWQPGAFFGIYKPDTFWFVEK